MSTSDERPLDLTADVIVTIDSAHACPVFPNKRYDDWDLPSPTGASIEEVRALSETVRLQVAALPESLTTANVGGSR